MRLARWGVIRPSPHLPRPRPGTPAAAAFAATYLLPTTDEAAAPGPGTLVAAAGNAGPQGDSLPARASLAAYLPALRLRTDLGPLRTDTELPAVLQIVRNGPAAGDDVAQASPVGRTQAFAAVPPVAGNPMIGNRRGEDARPPASYDAITALTRAADPDESSLPAITILADQLCWVELRASGKAVAQRLLRPGDRMDVPARRGLTLTAGNAGGIRILIDGVTAPALGGVGQVVRGVSLARHELLARR
jgi:cytoskeleton protein RodZ